MTTATNAERLEEAKALLGEYEDEWDKDIAIAYGLRFVKNYGNWLIEQAERAQELEARLKELEVESIQKLRRVNGYYDDLKRENDRLREALKIIAASGLDCIENECTYIAREALAGETSGQRQT